MNHYIPELKKNFCCGEHNTISGAIHSVIDVIRKTQFKVDLDLEDKLVYSDSKLIIEVIIAK